MRLKKHHRNVDITLSREEVDAAIRQWLHGHRRGLLPAENWTGAAEVFPVIKITESDRGFETLTLTGYKANFWAGEAVEEEGGNV